MILERNAAYLTGLVRELCKLPAETPWLEFKHNNADPQEIGEYISALSNGAALEGKGTAYLIWGVENDSHAIVGTTFAPHQSKKGNEELESWLLRLLSPRLYFRFHAFKLDGKAVVVLEIPGASAKPTSFEGRELIRIGSNKKPLKDFPEQERQLWRTFDHTPFEDLPAVSNLSPAQCLALLDHPAYFQLLAQPLPKKTANILDYLKKDGMVRLDSAGCWEITNLGVILFARDLHDFKALTRKALRLVVWEGQTRLKSRGEHVIKQGYASGFAAMIEFLATLLPRNEVIGRALRREVPLFPSLAVRELVANALIHQDFTITGAGPMVEIFADRMEITNPGVPLVDIERFLDSPPRSRNEALASFMRRIGICEERGSGVDKVVSETELYQLPPPRWETPGDSLRVMLFGPRELKTMEKNDRIHACYLHACLRHVMRDPMTNTSLRERFGIAPQNSAIASRIIRDTLAAKLIIPHGDARGKYAKYAPFWS